MRLKVVGFAPACVFGFAAAAVILFAGSPARAQTYYWTTTAGSMVGGSGTWDAATPNWSTTTSGDATLSAWTAGYSADFLANGPATVTVNGNQSVGNITFAGTGYTLAGTGTLTLSGSITVNSSGGTIGCLLGGGSGFVKGGAGQLTWNSTNNPITGTVEVSAGTLNVGNGVWPNGVFNSGTARTWQVDSGAVLTMGVDAATNTDSYVVSGGFLNETANSGLDASNYFTSVTMTGGTIGGGYIRAQSYTTGVVINSSTGGSVISSNVGMVAGTYGSDTLTFNVAHNSSAPYDLLLSGNVVDYPGLAGMTVSKTGAGLMAMSGANTYIGATVVGAGTLQIGNGGSGATLASPSISVSSGAVLAFNQADTLTISPSAGITGSGAVFKTGPGTVELNSTNNTYSGGTTINGGVLSAATTGSLPGFGNASPGSLTLGPGAGVAMQVGGAGWTPTVINSVLTSGPFPAGTYVGLDTTNGNYTYSNAITGIGSGGGGGLAKVGSNTLTLTNTNNSYTGGTLLASGELAFVVGALPLAANSLNFAGGAIQWPSGNIQDLSPYVAAVPAGILAGFDTNGNNVTFNNPITGSGGLSKLGNGVLILAGSNTYTGPTTIASGGTLQVGNGGTGVGFASSSVGGAGAIVFDNGNSLTYSGLINNSGGFVKSGTGQLTWNSLGNAITGTLEVAAGTLSVRAGVPSNGVFNNGTARTWQVDSGAVLATGQTFGSGTGNDVYVINNGGLWSMASGAGWDFYNYFSSLTMSGGTVSGGWLRAGSQTTGGVNVNSSASGSLIASGLSLTNPSGTMTFTVAHNASAPYDLLVSGAIADYPGIAGMAVNKAGPGLMVMSGSNTYIGPTIVSAGTLQIGNGGSGEALSSGSISIGSGAVLAFNQADTVTISPSAGISGLGALATFGSGTVVLGGTNNAYSGGTTINAGVLSAASTGSIPGFGNAAGGGITLAPGAALAVQLNGSGWTQAEIDSVRTTSNFPAGSYLGLDTTLGNYAYSNSIGGIWSGGGGGLAKVGSNTLTLTSTNNSYTGGTLLLGGTLDFTSGALPLSGIAFAGGTLQWAISNTEDISAGLAAIPSGQTANFDTNGNNVAFAAGVTGSGALNKLGAGAILAGSNTYSGATTITVGTLQVGNGVAGAALASPSVGGAGTMAFGNGGSLTYNGTLNNGGGLVVNGPGSVTWTATGNGMSGNVTVNGGTLALTGNGTNGNTAIFTGASGFHNYNVNPGGTLQLIGSWLGGNPNYIAINVNGGVLNSTPIIPDGDPEEYLSALSLTGGTIMSSNGTGFRMGNVGNGDATMTVTGTTSGSLVSCNITLVGVISVSPTTLSDTFNVSRGSSPADLTVTGNIVDFSAGGNYAGVPLVKTGNGIMVLAGSNTYSGPTMVNAGTLQIGNGTSGEALASASISVSSGAVLAFNETDSVTISPSGGISGGGALVAFGSGTVTLGSTNNTYTGGTTLNAGTIYFAAGALPLGPGSITFNGGTLWWESGNTEDVSAAIAPIATGVTASLRMPGSVSFATAISGGGGLRKLGVGTLYLTVANSYSGGTTISAGVLDFTSGALPLAANSINFAGGTLQWQTANTEDVSASVAAIPSGQMANFDTNGNNVAFGTAISGSGGLQKLGLGTLNLTTANSYSGGTTLSGGTLNIAGDSSLGETASPVYLDSGDLQAGAAGITLSASRTIIVGGTVTLDTQGYNMTVAGSINGSGWLIKNGSGQLNCSSQNNAFLGTIEVAAGTLSVGAGVPNWGIFNSQTARTWQVDSGAVLATQYAYGSEAGSDNFVINNGGLWSIAPGAGVDVYNYFGSIAMSGGTISGGWLRANGGNGGVTINASPGGSVISSPISLAQYGGGATLVFTVAHNGSAPYDLLLNFIADYTNAPGFAGNGVTKTGPGLMVMAGSNTYSGPTTVAGGTLQIGNGTSGEYLASPSITMSNNAVVAFNHADGLSYGGTISGSGQLVKLGTGNLDLVGSGTYSGPTTISAGTLELDGNGDNLPAATALTIAASGVLDLAGNPLTVGSLSGSAGAVVTNSLSSSYLSTLTVAPSSGSTTFAGNIIGNDALALSGSGELTLSGTNTYTGGTTVSGGTLDIAAPSALAGSGLVTIAAGGRLVLGSGAGIGALLAASSPASSGAVALSAAAVPATIGGYQSASENTTTLGDAPALSSGAAGSGVVGAAAAVPEPGAIALLAVGVLMLAVARRRRRR